MNYSKIYNDLVAKAKVRGLDKSKHKGYFEIHHIVPVCLGGTNDTSNLVMFTGQEHYIAHMLLWKAYPENISLMRAAHIMSSRWINETVGGSGAGINSKVYAQLRAEYAQAVSVQWSGENNPMFGKTHSPEVFERIAKTRAKTTRKNHLREWKRTNTKFMSQFKYKKDTFQAFLINIGSDFPVFRFKGQLEDWLAFEVYKNFWERSGKTGPKDFSTKIQKVSGTVFSGTYFKTMTERFSEGINLSDNPDFIVKALNNNSDEYITAVEDSLKKTLEEIDSEYISIWMEQRASKRNRIESALSELGVEKHKYNSKAKFSLVDVTEALILWRSGHVTQKYLAGLYDVARNSVSNALEVKDRWLEVKNNVERIEGMI